MVVPFTKQQQIHGRYEMLSPQDIIKQLEENGSDVSRYDGQEYATFMRTLNTGALKPLQRLSRPTVQPTLIKRSHTSPSDISSKNSQSISVQNGSLAINQIKMKNEENHRKKLKIIEDYMFLCKQQERELKRIEGDIVKKERTVKKKMKNYESEIYLEKRQQEKQLSTADNEQETIKQKYHIEDEKITKEKINRNITNIQKEKEHDSKSANTLNGLEFRFGSIAEAINLKRIEVHNLVEEFESNVRQKEKEEFQLKKEFANLASELNMTAQKQRSQVAVIARMNAATDQKDKATKLLRSDLLQEKLRFQKAHVNRTEHNKRRLSKELNGAMVTLSMQDREEGRRLVDVKSKLYDNALNQKEANIKSELLEMERRGILSDEKLMGVNARRKVMQDMVTQQRKQKNDLSIDEWRQRNLSVNHKAKKENVKDSVNHFEKVVTKHDEIEHALFYQVRQLESDRHKQENIVKRLRDELSETERQNKILLRETALRCQQQEFELQQQLQKEEALLGKTVIQREEKIGTLAKCRGASKEDRHMLQEEKKVQNRLHRIEEKSDILRTQKQYQEI